MKKIFSGIQPSGVLTIGNYIGAIKQFVELQKDYDCIFSIVDYHAITQDYKPKEMPDRIMSAAYDFLACGIDPKKSILFVQSDRPEHTELAWILNTITPLGDLQRMTQFREKSEKINENVGVELFQKILKNHKEIDDFENALNVLSKAIENNELNDKEEKELRETLEKLRAIINEKTFREINAGLLNYPILMAADILIYKAGYVPVGEDQIQHIELAREIARRFNNKFGKTFPEPEPIIRKGSRILGLDGLGKMSKSNAPHTYIALSDKPEMIKEKISAAVTDQGTEKEISASSQNLLTLLEIFAGPSVANKFIDARKNGTIKYSELKPVLAEAIIKELEPIQKKRDELEKNPAAVKKILENGAQKLEPKAKETLKEVKNIIGLKY